MKNVNKFNRHIKKGYVKIQNELFRLDLPSGAIVLYVFLRSMPESYYPTPGSVKKYIHLSKKTYYKYMNILEQCRLIKRISSFTFNLENPKENKSNIYEFVDKKSWVKYKTKPKNKKELNIIEMDKWS